MLTLCQSSISLLILSAGYIPDGVTRLLDSIPGVYWDCQTAGGWAFHSHSIHEGACSCGIACHDDRTRLREMLAVTMFQQDFYEQPRAIAVRRVGLAS